MQCVKCNSSRVKKHGFNRKGNQRYSCHGCGVSFVDNPVDRRLRDDEKVLASKLQGEGLATRAIARVLGRDEKTLRTFFKK